MARPLRIEFPGAVYHVTSRGNAPQAIFLKRYSRMHFSTVSRAIKKLRENAKSDIASLIPKRCRFVSTVRYHFRIVGQLRKESLMGTFLLAPVLRLD